MSVSKYLEGTPTDGDGESEVPHFDATQARKNKMRRRAEQQPEAVAAAPTPSPLVSAAPESSAVPPDSDGQRKQSQGGVDVEQAQPTAPSSTGPIRLLESFLIDFVAKRTGYPPGVVDLDSDFEADLGIDAIQRSQLLDELRKILQLSESERSTFIGFSSVRDVLDFLQRPCSQPSASSTAGSGSGSLSAEPGTHGDRSLDDWSPGSTGAMGRRAAELYAQYVNPVLIALGGPTGWIKTFVRGEGSELWDADGRRHLDFVAGCGSLNLGHNPRKVVEAIAEAMQRQAPGFAQSSVNPYAAALAERLADLTPAGLEMVFFGNSGTEVVEAALKLARIASERPGLLYCDGSYHGKSLGALSVTGHQPFQQPFEPLIPNCRSIPYGDIQALESALATKEFAAFIVEPVQGERGTIIPPADYLGAAQDLCRSAGTLLVVDEVQTGLGRTGELFACDGEGVEPDVMTLAKSLGGGLMPIGAMLTRRELWQKAYGTLQKFALHTSSFGGGSLACAAALAALDALSNERLIENVRERGDQLLRGLQRVARDNTEVIREVRGRGLMLGLELHPLNETVASLVVFEMQNGGAAAMQELLGDAEAVVAALPTTFLMQQLVEEQGIYSLAARSNPLVLRVQPPLTITADEVDRFIAAVEEICHEMRDPFAIVGKLFFRIAGDQPVPDAAAESTKSRPDP